MANDTLQGVARNIAHKLQMELDDLAVVLREHESLKRWAIRQDLATLGLELQLEIKLVPIGEMGKSTVDEAAELDMPVLEFFSAYRTRDFLADGEDPRLATRLCNAIYGLQGRENAGSIRQFLNGCNLADMTARDFRDKLIKGSSIPPKQRLRQIDKVGARVADIALRMLDLE